MLQLWDALLSWSILHQLPDLLLTKAAQDPDNIAEGEKANIQDMEAQVCSPIHL